MTTNNQAALQAAATVFAGGRGHTAPADVKGMAQSFKGWLDAQDAAVAKVEQAETVSHHISCSSRRANECNCSALPYIQPTGLDRTEPMTAREYLLQQTQQQTPPKTQCPLCQARSGEPCLTVMGPLAGTPLSRPHASR